VNNAPEKKRPWFQYHLSTAILLMFVAGGLLWVNLRVPNSYAPGEGGLGMYDILLVRQYGWPCTFYEEFYSTGIVGGAKEFEKTTVKYVPWQGIIEYKNGHIESLTVQPSILDKCKYMPNHWQPASLLIDALTMLGILFVTAFICELPIRRKERRNA